MAQPRQPLAAPQAPAIFKHRAGERHLSQDIGAAFGEALSEDAGDLARPLLVKRRRTTLENTAHMNVDLETYVRFRATQGIEMAQAMQEWNGAQAMRVSD